MNEPELIDRILRDAKTIAVVGLTDSPGRASYGVSQYMQQRGYRIIPINPTRECILGEKSFASLGDVPEKIDLVNVFRAPRHIPGIVDEVIGLKIPFLWLQEGVVDHAAALKAEAAGVGVVMDRCLFKEHSRR
jgi:predicted CoA-binding protein